MLFGSWTTMVLGSRTKLSSEDSSSTISSDSWSTLSAVVSPSSSSSSHVVVSSLAVVTVVDLVADFGVVVPGRVFSVTGLVVTVTGRGGGVIGLCDDGGQVRKSASFVASQPLWMK